MAKSNLRLLPPSTEKGTVAGMRPPRRPPNRELREREHLTDAEVERLVEPPEITATAPATLSWFWSPTGTDCAPPR
jgi:hypothetical protein